MTPKISVQFDKDILSTIVGGCMHPDNRLTVTLFSGSLLIKLRRAQSLINIHRKNWLARKHSLIFFDLFTERGIDRTGKTVRLRSNATHQVQELFNTSKKCRHRSLKDYKTNMLAK